MTKSIFLNIGTLEFFGLNKELEQFRLRAK